MFIKNAIYVDHFFAIDVKRIIITKSQKIVPGFSVDKKLRNTYC